MRERTPSLPISIYLTNFLRVDKSYKQSLVALLVDLAGIHHTSTVPVLHESRREREDLCDLSLKAFVSFSLLCPFCSLLVGSRGKIRQAASCAPDAAVSRSVERGKKGHTPGLVILFLWGIFFLFSLSILIGCGGGHRRSRGAKGKHKKGKWKIGLVRTSSFDRWPADKAILL